MTGSVSCNMLPAIGYRQSVQSFQGRPGSVGAARRRRRAGRRGPGVDNPLDHRGPPSHLLRRRQGLPTRTSISPETKKMRRLVRLDRAQEGRSSRVESPGPIALLSRRQLEVLELLSKVTPVRARLASGWLACPGRTGFSPARSLREVSVLWFSSSSPRFAWRKRIPG